VWTGNLVLKHKIRFAQVSENFLTERVLILTKHFDVEQVEAPASARSKTRFIAMLSLTRGNQVRSLGMRVNKVIKTGGRTVLMMVLLGGVGIASSNAVQAQKANDVYIQQRGLNSNDKPDQRGRNWERYGSYGGSTELRQTALNAGYTEGLSEGRQNRETGRHADLRGDGIYQRATKGYMASLGDRELYRRYFREAFEDGYNSELSAIDDNDRDKTRSNQAGRNRYRDGYGNFGGSFQLRQTALNAGFNEGTRQGRADLYKHKSNSYQKQSAYQKATRDYSNSLGDREIYQRYYREAYEHGYAEGFGGN
jgi:hypothetical protein